MQDESVRHAIHSGCSGGSWMQLFARFRSGYGNGDAIAAGLGFGVFLSLSDASARQFDSWLHVLNTQGRATESESESACPPTGISPNIFFSFSRTDVIDEGHTHPHVWFRTSDRQRCRLRTWKRIHSAAVLPSWSQYQRRISHFLLRVKDLQKARGHVYSLDKRSSKR